MKALLLKSRQAELKEQYRSDSAAAKTTLFSEGKVDPANLAVEIQHPPRLNPAGLHPHGGGDNSFVCPVEIMLAGLVSCAGVTLAAVANSMGIELKAAKLRAEGDIDFRGTLAVDRQTPVALTAIRLIFELDSSAGEGQIEKLIELTHRYCVVHRTLDAPPSVAVSVHRV